MALRFSLEDPFRFENWYDCVRDITFESAIVPLSYSQAMALKRCKEISIGIEKSTNGSIEYSVLCESVNGYLSTTEKQLLLQIELQIDEAITALDAKNGVFVKLSTRSPKDAILSSPKLKQIMKSKLDENTYEDEEEWTIAAVNAFIFSACHALKINSGKEALQLLYLSKRTYDDIVRTDLENGQENFNLPVIVRKWVDIEPGWEFRAFVHNQKLCAASQYFKLCYVPDIVKKKSDIEKLITRFFETRVKHKLKIDSYTIDFAISPDLSQIWLIEINNPPPVSGCSLYNWGSPTDREEMTHLPFTMRILATPSKNALKEVYQPILPYIQSLTPNFYSSSKLILIGVLACTAVAVGVHYYLENNKSTK